MREWLMWAVVLVRHLVMVGFWTWEGTERQFNAALDDLHRHIVAVLRRTEEE